MSQHTTTLHIEGMSCGHCVRAVRDALAETPGVDVEDVQIGHATVRYDDAQTTPDGLVAVIDEAGYTVTESA